MRSRRLGPSADTDPKTAWLIPFAIAAVYLILFITQLHHNIRELDWSSDYSSGFTIPETLAMTGTGGHTVMGGSGQWVALLFGWLTATLPLHRALWEVGPTLMLVASALMIGWSVAQISTRRRAILAVLLVLVASPWALYFFMAAVAHNTVYPCTALLGAYMVWLTRGQRRRPAVTLAAVVSVGVITGACLASDLLLSVTAVIPFTLTAILAAPRRARGSRPLALYALATMGLAVGVAVAMAAEVRSLGFVQLATPTELAPLSELSQRAQLLFKGLKGLFNGFLGPLEPGTLHAELGIACVVLMSAALLTLLVFGTLTTVKFIWSWRRPLDSERPTELTRSLHIIYWFSSGASACGAALLTAGLSSANTHESYYGSIIFSVAAVIPLLTLTRAPARWLVQLGASIFFTASIVGLLGHYFDVNFEASHHETEIVRFAQANHTTVGFAGYWEAASLTWNSGDRVLARPVMTCPNPGGVDICPFSIARVPSWYVPQKRRTFLLVDSAESWLPALPAGLGPPLATAAFGSMQMYIYPYDIAARVGPAPN